MKTLSLLLITATTLAFGTFTPPAPAALTTPIPGSKLNKPLPAHWGEPPKAQTRDLVKLPDGYGYGSSTLAKWVQQNIDKDKQAASQNKPVEPPAAKPPAEKPAPEKAPAEKNVPDRTKPIRPAKELPAPTPLPEPVKEPDKKISDKERKAIEDYVAKHQAGEEAKGKGKGKGKGQTKKSLPPGLEKKLERTGELPPGWQNKLVEGETLPEPVLQQAQPLPKEITAQLPPPPAGVTNVVVEGKVVRVLQKSRQILDVLDLNK